MLRDDNKILAFISHDDFMNKFPDAEYIWIGSIGKFQTKFAGERDYQVYVPLGSKPKAEH